LQPIVFPLRPWRTLRLGVRSSGGIPGKKMVTVTIFGKFRQIPEIFRKIVEKCLNFVTNFGVKSFLTEYGLD